MNVGIVSTENDFFVIYKFAQAEIVGKAEHIRNEAEALKRKYAPRGEILASRPGTLCRVEC